MRRTDTDLTEHHLFTLKVLC